MGAAEPPAPRGLPEEAFSELRVQVLTACVSKIPKLTQTLLPQAEGDLWGALSLLELGACLREAVLLLRRSGQPDCALAFQAACKQAGFHTSEGPSDSGTPLTSVWGQALCVQMCPKLWLRGVRRHKVCLLGQPDCASAVQAAWRQAGFHTSEGPSDSGTPLASVWGQDVWVCRCVHSCDSRVSRV